MLDLKQIIEESGSLSSARYSELMNAEPCSGEAKRSFSNRMLLLIDGRNFLDWNVEQYLICHVNSFQ